MDTPNRPRVVCLSNVFDQHYHDLREDELPRCLSLGKRRDLFACLQSATERELILLSAPPKALERKWTRWLPAVRTQFYDHPQFFCANWDAPKLCLPFSWFSYALHVLKHVRDGDILVLDNYELIYVLAARVTAMFRKVKIILDYEDGKHLIDKGWVRLLSGAAERLGRGLLDGALLAHPALAGRLPAELPKVLVPGFVLLKAEEAKEHPAAGNIVRFLYSGSLDEARGVDLLLAALAHLPTKGWRLDISGWGPLADSASDTAAQPQYVGKVFVHGTLEAEAYKELVAACDAGLNCQRASDPISSVTFPSKVFTYLSGGLLVLSSKASAVPEICADACYYYDEESADSLAEAMSAMITDWNGVRDAVHPKTAELRYSMPATRLRLQEFLTELSITA